MSSNKRVLHFIKKDVGNFEQNLSYNKYFCSFVIGNTDFFRYLNVAALREKKRVNRLQGKLSSFQFACKPALIIQY